MAIFIFWKYLVNFVFRIWIWARVKTGKLSSFANLKSFHFIFTNNFQKQRPIIMFYMNETKVYTKLFSKGMHRSKMEGNIYEGRTDDMKTETPQTVNSFKILFAESSDAKRRSKLLFPSHVVNHCGKVMTGGSLDSSSLSLQHNFAFIGRRLWVSITFFAQVKADSILILYSF